MKKITACLIFIAICTSLSTAFAQRGRRRVTPTSKYSLASAYYARNKYVAIGGSIGASNYFGDIAPTSSFISTDLRFTRPSISAFVIYRIRKKISLKGSFAWSRIMADDFNANPSDKDDRYRFVRNLSFRNDIKEFDATVVFDWWQNRQNFLKRNNFNPYFFIGVGIIAHNPKAKEPVSFGDKWIALQPLGTEGQGRPGYQKPYSRVTMVIPFGLGFRYKVKPRVDIGFEWSFRYTFTDYLDDVSGKYADPSVFTSPLARAMADRTLEPVGAYSGKSRVPGMDKFYGIDSPNPFAKPVPGFGQKGDQRGNSGRNDYYMTTGITIYYLYPPHGKRSRFR